MKIIYILIYILILLQFFVIIYFFIDRYKEICKYNKRSILLKEYDKLCNIVFNFYKNRDNLIIYKNEYNKFHIIINQYFNKVDRNEKVDYNDLIIKIKDIHKHIIPEIKKEIRKDNIKRALKF